MNKNLIPEIIKMLGVEYGEEFKIRRPDYEVCEKGVYAFFENEGLMKKNEQGEFDNNSSIEFEDLCLGDYEVVKIPWEPKYGELYWTISFSTNFTVRVIKKAWEKDCVDFTLLRLGMVYRTMQEAADHMAEDYMKLTGKKLEG